MQNDDAIEKDIQKIIGKSTPWGKKYTLMKVKDLKVNELRYKLQREKKKSYEWFERKPDLEFYRALIFQQVSEVKEP